MRSRSGSPYSGSLREIPPGQTALAYEAMRELRPGLGSAEEFTQLVDERLRPEGYRLVAAFAGGGEEHAAQSAVAVAGFRVMTSLAAGRTLYVDDLSTRPEARRQGHARALLDWLAREAAAQGCEHLHLDSNVIPEREDAHRLYFNSGMRIASYHFARALPREG